MKFENRPTPGDRVLILNAYNSINNIEQNFYDKRKCMLIDKEPLLIGYYVKYLDPQRKAQRELSRYIFLLKLQDDPVVIDLNSVPYKWAIFTPEWNELQEWINKDPEIRRLWDATRQIDFLSKEAQDYVSLLNDTAQPHSSKLFKMEDACISDMNKVQKQLIKEIKNRQNTSSLAF